MQNWDDLNDREKRQIVLKSARESNRQQLDMIQRSYAKKVLVELIEQGHGGGNWRRLILQKIEELKGENMHH